MSKKLERQARKLQDQGQNLVSEAGARAGAAVDALTGHKESHWGSNLGWLLLGLGLGTLATYLLDPDRGQHRQAALRDRVVQAGQAVPQQLRQVQSRLQGSPAEDADGPTSPAWEIAHNDHGSLTGPSY